MKNQSDILKQEICEQIAIEENICTMMEEKISEIEGTNFIDARGLLSQVSMVLESHYGLLNDLLTKLEESSEAVQEKDLGEKTKELIKSFDRENDQWRISRILRDVYSALSLITISNTQLNTIGLALNNKEVADIALNHLEVLAPLVVKMGLMAPEVVTRELRKNDVPIDPSAVQIALENTKLAWCKT